MKKGKEVNVKLNKKFKTYYGTIDNKDLKTVYVGISTWVIPLFDLDDYSRHISKIRKKIKTGIYQNINSQLFRNDHHIVDIDIKDSRIEFNKSSYLHVEIILFSKIKESVLSYTIKNDMIRFINGILSSIETSDYFEFVISKKKNVSTI
jgi:hypothetical protein